MVDLQGIKDSLRREGIENGYVEGSLSVPELARNIANIFDNHNQTGSRDGPIDVSLASELVLNWILNVYDPWVQKYYKVWHNNKNYLKLKWDINKYFAVFVIKCNFSPPLLLLIKFQMTYTLSCLLGDN